MDHEGPSQPCVERPFVAYTAPLHACHAECPCLVSALPLAPSPHCSPLSTHAPFGLMGGPGVAGYCSLSFSSEQALRQPFATVTPMTPIRHRQ